MDVLERIKEQVESNPVILYMKGTPQMPQCGFSSRTAEALKSCGHEFAYVNVLMDPGDIRTASLCRLAHCSRSFIYMASWSEGAILPWTCMKKVSCKRW